MRDAGDNTMELRVAQMKDNGRIFIEWSAVGFSKALERWRRFKSNGPYPATVAEARALIKDFQKKEAKRSEPTNTGRVPG